ncbi:hypothetical protein M514_26105, partial [Trichuris suis]
MSRLLEKQFFGLVKYLPARNQDSTVNPPPWYGDGYFYVYRKRRLDKGDKDKKKRRGFPIGSGRAHVLEITECFTERTKAFAA